MNDLFSTEISIEERTEKKNIMITNAMFQLEKNLFTEETQNMQDKKNKCI